MAKSTDTGEKAPKKTVAKKAAAKKTVSKKAAVKKKAVIKKKSVAKKKATVKKKAAAKKAATSPRVQKISDAQRRQMIAEAAYLRGESQGFLSDEQEDWLLAEAEVDDRLVKAGIALEP